MAMEDAEDRSDRQCSFRWFWMLLTVGVVAVLVGTVILVASSFSSGQIGLTSFEAVIFIGPFPIMIGVGPDVGWVILASLIVLGLSAVVLMMTLRKRREAT